MTAKFEARDVMAALNALERARDASTTLPSLGQPMTDEQLQQRADLTAKVITTRAKLQLIRDRTEELKSALERFRARRESMRA